LQKSKMAIVLLLVLSLSLLVSGCAGSEPETDKKKVAVVFSTPIGASQFVQLINDGAQAAAKDFADEIELKTVESPNLDAVEENLRAMAKAGYDLVVTHSFDTAEILTKVAKEFPDTKFMTIDAFIDLPNVRSAQFREHEGMFLVGMVAASMSETGRIGYVGASDTPFGHRWAYGYEQGAKHVKEDIVYTDGYVGSYNDPARAKELALAQQQKGADVIMASAAGGNYGVFEAAKEKGFYTFSVDVDECHLDPDHIIGSMVKKSDVAVYTAMKELAEGDLTTGQKTYGLKERGVGLCILEYPDHPENDIPQEVLDKVKEAREQIASGELKVIDYVEVNVGK
jgi:basic membrane protein A